ncbi:hypothetical protein B0H13DRAFT_2233955 [Mycena leptocephala]|nr:hypothetical protein B0H13DRAFT_2233955 [Mycena leptocephala]
MREPVTRKTTDENVKKIQAAVKSEFQFTPTPSSIWNKARLKDISPRIRGFLWRSIHGANRIGKYWTHIPECGDRANCTHCGEEESLEHILLSCPSPGQNWPEPSLGLILGAGLASFKDDKGKPNAAKARLYTILMTESARLIWKLRCDSIIGRSGVAPTPNEIHNRWVKIMNDRLQMDINLTDKIKHGKQHVLAPTLVLETWSGTLAEEDKLPKDWLREPGVLVGIAPTRSRRSPSPPTGRRGRNR